MSIYLTGATGFVGKNLIIFLGDKADINKHYRGSEINIKEEIVIHLAGKAHDLKKVASDTDYYLVNTDFTKDVFNAFLSSDAKVFIFLSSVKAVADEVKEILTEELIPYPITHYGKSKLLAEEYILSKPTPTGKRIYILRPCMIHGPGNKGNLNLLYNLVSKGFPWPLGAFHNKRSFCSIDNLCFIINELITNYKIPSGVYNVADDESFSTNELIKLISESQGKKTTILNISKFLVIMIAKLGDFLSLPFNTERLNKLTQSYVVSNKKITESINKKLPVTTKEGLMKTLNSLNY
jgi:nucleoside-diphosphate-sugar epimerase